MKNLKSLALVAIAAAALSSCGNSTPKADLKTDVDSMSYAIGTLQSQYIRQVIQSGQAGIDTAYIDEVVSLRAPTPATTRRRPLTSWVFRSVRVSLLSL